VTVLVATVFCLLDGTSRAQDDELRLRVNDATGVPGGLVAIVVRTYAPRGIRQGQMCFRALWNETEGYGDTPFVGLESAIVFSQRSDAESDGVFEEVHTQSFVVRFDSPSASVNAVKGPLAVFFLRLDPTLTEGRKFGIEFDLDNTSLVDASGAPVPLRLDGGRLTIRAPGSPYPIAAQGQNLRAGEVAESGLETFEPLALSSGVMALRYDPAVVQGAPRVRMDARYGLATFSTVSVDPGLIVVAFNSPNASLNFVPGEILTVAFDTPAFVPPGRASRVELDPSMTFLVDADGNAVWLDLVSNSLRFRPKRTRPDRAGGGAAN